MSCHVDVEGAAVDDVFVVQDEGALFAATGVGEGLALQGLPIEEGAADVESAVAEAMSADGEGLATADVERGFLHQWRAENIAATTGFHLVEAEGGEDVPGGHLTHIFVAAETCGLVGVELTLDLMYDLGGLAGLAHEGVEVGDVVRGLIAVGVLPDEACDVGVGVGVELAVGSEEAVEALQGAFSV